MNIEKVVVYRVMGKDFPTLEKAKDYVEGEVNKLVNTMLTYMPKISFLSMTDSIPITTFLLDNARQFRSLLSCLIDSNSLDREEEQ